MHTDRGTPKGVFNQLNGLDTMGSAHNTVTPPYNMPVIYIEILLFRNLSPFNV